MIKLTRVYVRLWLGNMILSLGVKFVRYGYILMAHGIRISGLALPVEVLKRKSPEVLLPLPDTTIERYTKEKL